jgi:NAD(P)-dependent dehydrogenase (short-subunit alcohol dehydrogenase family)
MPHTYLVTGANRGLGLEFATQLKAQGHTVIGTAREPGDAAELARVADRVLPLDITDAASVEALASDLVGTPIDVLINNAATGLTKGGVEGLDLDAMEREYAINSVGPIRVTRALLPNLRAGEGKKAVFLTSILGSIEMTGSKAVGGGLYAYRSSKAALNMLVRTLADELKGEGFTCLAIHPGWVKTRMGGDDAPMTPEKSIGGMLPVIQGATAGEHNGVFLDFRGKTIPW